MKPVDQAAPAAKPAVALPVTPTAPEATTAPVAVTPKPAVTTALPAPAAPAKQAVKPPAKPSPAPTPVAAATPKPAAKPVAVTKPAPQPKPPVASPIETPASADKPATVASITPPAPIKVSLDNLPLTIGDAWILDRTEASCSLASKPVQLDDGQGGTPVTLQITPDSLRITTISDIDTTYEKTGITIDQHAHFDLETVERRTNLVFTRQKNRLLNVMQNGQQFTLTLGFWPTWPQTQTYSVDIPLQGFASAMTALNTCNRLLKQP
ncbi:MAG: hypothetical protein R3F47_03045 [Gammaproteobacteria bacterium]